MGISYLPTWTRGFRWVVEGSLFMILSTLFLDGWMVDSWMLPTYSNGLAKQVNSMYRS